MGMTLGDIVGGMLARYPHWYERMTYEEKVISFNMLLADGKYFDTVDGVIKSIPHRFWRELGADGIPVISHLHEPQMQEHGVPCARR